jgi:hypothetical protein
MTDPQVPSDKDLAEKRHEAAAERVIAAMNVTPIAFDTSVEKNAPRKSEITTVQIRSAQIVQRLISRARHRDIAAEVGRGIAVARLFAVASSRAAACRPQP